MHSWADFEAAKPVMAATARRLFWIPGFGLGYLATVRRDGAPRIHPIDVAIVNGLLLAFIVPSPKLDDLRRDGRYALHSPGSETETDEIMLAGRALIRDGDAALRAAVVDAMPFSPGEDHVLVELRLDTVLWAEYSTPPSWPPRYHRWRAAGPSGLR